MTSERAAAKTKVWHNLVRTIDNASDQCIQNYLQLSADDKRRVLDSIARRLEAGDYRVAKDDRRSTEQVDALQKISGDIVTILGNWSDRKSSFYTFFNHSLPQPIRAVSWSLYLATPNYRQKFLDDLSNHPQSVLSPMDTEVQQKCDRLISLLPSASEMKNSQESRRVMEIILSYYRALFRTTRNLTDAECYYVVPIILTQKPLLSEPNAESLASLVEMYRTFMDSIPAGLLDNSIETLEPWFRQVEYHINKIDQPIYIHLQTVLHRDCLRSLADAQISMTNDSDTFFLLRKYCQSWFRNLFVDCLTTDALLFVWDQYLITRNLPDFHNDFLPAVATTIILNLRESLLECRKTSQIEAILESKTSTIEASQIRSLLQRFFLPDSTSQFPIPHHHTDNQEAHRHPIPKLHQSVNPVYDLLGTIAKTCHRVAHGEASSGQILDSRTKETYRKHQFDLKMAEREVYGRLLNTNELNALPFERKVEYNERKMRVVIHRIQHRYLSERKELTN